MADLLRIATSGLLAHQGALNVAGHNIANASVDGYSRQRIEFVNMPSYEVGGLKFGNGVDVNGVSRLIDQFASAQLRSDTSVAERAQVFGAHSEQLDSLFADASPKGPAHADLVTHILIDLAPGVKDGVGDIGE